MKLIDLIKVCDRSKVFDFILKKGDEGDSKNNTIEYVTSAYSSTLDEMLKKELKESRYKIYVKMETDWHFNYLKENPDKKHITDTDDVKDYQYIDASLLNLDFEGHPDRSLEAWGGKSEDKNDCPEGCYNCNYEGYQEYYGIGNTSWGSLLNSEIVDTLNLSNENLLAEILWEITFYGFEEKEQTEFWDMLKDRAEESKIDLDKL